MKNYRQQSPVIQRLFIDDWTRKALAYDTFFEGEVYHMVETGTGLEVQKNEREIVPNTAVEKKEKTREFKGYSPRPNKLNSLNDSRFEIINKDPSILTNTRTPIKFEMKKCRARPELFAQT